MTGPNRTQPRPNRAWALTNDHAQTPYRGVGLVVVHQDHNQNGRAQ